MDAVEFVMQEIRMCASYEDCTECPLCNTIYCSVSPKKRSQEEISEIVRRVEEWSAAHPRKTRQSIFLELYPETVLDGNGVITICPVALSKSHRSNSGECKNPENRCSDCRREFWMQKVE